MAGSLPRRPFKAEQPAATADGQSRTIKGSASPNFPIQLMADGDGHRSARERFNVNAQTGGASLSIPIETSPGRSGFGPYLNLVYNSGSAATNGIFGLGWQLDGVESISRQTSRSIPFYEDNKDCFVHSRVGELVPVLNGEGIFEEAFRGNHLVQLYRPRVEADPMRIERWVESDRPDRVHWRTITSENVTVIYGRTEQSRISQGAEDDPSAMERCFSWMACEMYDSYGNHMIYEYKAEDASGVQPEQDVWEAHRTNLVRFRQRYLRSIKYGNMVPNRDLATWKVLDAPPPGQKWMFQVILDYGEYDKACPTPGDPGTWSVRPDPFSTGVCGFELRTYRLCQRVLMFHHFPDELGRADCLVASTDFTYRTEPRSETTFLRSCTISGYSPVGDKLYSSLSLPPTEFEYSEPPDLQELKAESFGLSLSGLTSQRAQWVDLNGDGVAGVLVEIPGSGWYYHRNQSDDEKTEVSGPILVPTVPSSADLRGWSFEDLDGDGLLDLTSVSPDGSIRGCYERLDNGEWKSFVPFRSYPVMRPFQLSGAVYKIDLTGNGRTDMLRMTPGEDGELSWYKSLGPEGYGEEQRTIGAPRFPAEETGSIFLRDMNGDGLTDIVWVRNGNITFWPNLGHGRFGPKVIMGNAPFLPDGGSFSPHRFRMADVTGSGGTDLIYMLPEGGALVFYSRWGNCWTDGHLLPSFPPLDSSCAVDVFDIRGNGTQCLCWSSDLRSATAGATAVRFMDLMGGRKPGLLTKSSNGIGGETAVTYRSSTRYRLDDERAGRPWATRLPFTIDCVKSTTSVDLIAQTSYTRCYAYHDGYYDPIERQFRGFEMVELRDSEYWITDGGRKLQRPPVLTKQWFFVGLERLDEAIDLPGSLEVDRPSERPLSSARIPANLTAEETRQAYRALVGYSRRQEIYCEDGSSDFPYTISQQTYDVVVHQRMTAGLQHAIFRVNSREKIEAQYERNPNDARIQHTLALETDDYGNIMKAATINYGRLDSALPRPEDQQKQMETVVIYAETSYTNPILDQRDYFQAPLVSGATQYRVYPGTHLEGAIIDGRYDWESLAADQCKLLQQAVDIPVHENAKDRIQNIPHEGYKALLLQTVTLYYQEDLKAPLPQGWLDPFSPRYQSYQLMATTELLENTLKDDSGLLLEPDALERELQHGGYIQLDNRTSEWWTPSRRNHFQDNKGSDALQVARSQFYIPNIEIDQFRNTSIKALDKYNLLLEQSQNAVGDITSFVNHYARLQPTQITDENDNRTQSALDPLGRPVGVAVMGKIGENVGDSLDGFEIPVKQEDLDKLINNPSPQVAAELLKNSGKRTVYVLDRYTTSQEPTFYIEIVRDTHYRDGPTKISIRITYINGNGGTIQTVTLSDRKWQFSGCLLRDRKAQTVKESLPFFSPTHHFRLLTGKHDAPATTFLRDPLDKDVAVLNADHTWSKNRFTPWAKTMFDAGNTVLLDDPATDPDVGSSFQKLERSSYYPTWYSQRMKPGTPEDMKKAALKSEVYNNTPTVVHVDPLGREILHQRVKGQLDPQSIYEDRKEYDERGNILVLTDALDRIATRAQYDLLGRPLHEISMDKGETWIFPDCAGAPIFSWSGGGPPKHIQYDALRRSKITEVKLDGSPAFWAQTIMNVYGEECGPDAAKFNLKGKLYQCRDQSGMQTNHNFDFKGNCLESSVLYAEGYKEVLDWSRGDVPIKPTRHQTQSSFDAVSHTISTKSTGCDGVIYKYDVAGRLKSLRLTSAKDDLITPLVDDIEYSADDQVTLVYYHNKSEIVHNYNDQTRRLTTTMIKNSKSLQDISYTYDCLGKLVIKTDDAEQTIYFQNTVVRPTQEFSYDAFGQLLDATGREQVNTPSNAPNRLVPVCPGHRRQSAVPGDGRQMIEYCERYKYDLAGNILQMEHKPLYNSAYAGWTRAYQYQEPSWVDPNTSNNRLTRTKIGVKTEEYKYEGEAGRGGCMTSIPGYSNLSWDHNSRLHSFSAQKVGRSGTPETTWYVYNSRGDRVRKVTERATGPNGPSTTTKLKETLYLPLCDISTTYSGDGVSMSRKITTMKSGALSGSHTPMVIVETTVKSNPSSEQCLVRYQMSENLELDDQANVVSYEEYSPYGVSTYQARKTGAPRKYRFAGYERDGESGLYHCGERYYACWIGRWTSPDPLDKVEGLNLYTYVANNPVNFQDHGGTVRDKDPKPSGSRATSTWRTYNKHDNHGWDFEVQIGSEGREISLRSADPIRSGLHLISSALNDETGHFTAGYVTLGGAPEKQLLHGFAGESSAEILLPLNDPKLSTEKFGGKEGKYKYEFRIDWDDRKEVRHVNLEIKAGKRSQNYALFYQSKPDKAESIVAEQLSSSVDVGSKKLKKRFDSWLLSGESSAEPISTWYQKYIKSPLDSGELSKNSEKWFHTQEVIDLTSFCRSAGEFEESRLSEMIGARLWIWAQHRLNPERIMEELASFRPFLF
ncbi:hypothetical protein EYZ11_010776 [Aspergillus tanneri]|uniref:Insecticide toxin TcdB middle/N-terminal domain-containing protein n=1 Tax=Aspergillus tanneri TaxID=1220188 RepID=A0A4S3J6L9_9EURO|nr:uncharacterized protein ATNIH1004_005442 [Aspergillus tanneri]KAA8646767.1 hypothetical protein ATNIH1004_005442 [Aspergillus tanneri]THC89768.1 hypothetical protein EYZ11_010776 [Aspergillus tanneri]